MANYYDEYRNDLYNPDDGHDTRRPGRNANWKAIQKGFKDTQGEIDRLDGRVDDLAERVVTAEEHVANLEERVTSEEAFNREQQVQINANTAKNTEQDGRLGNIDDAIERIDAKDDEQDDRLDALEESQDAQDVLIREHGNRLTAHDASIADINTRISRINAKNDEQDAAIADINAKDTEQDSAISDLADDVQRIDDSVNRVATDPATSRSTRIGNNNNNLTVSTYTENDTKSMDFIDNVNEDRVQFGFLENDTGHMVTFGNLAFNFDDIVKKNNNQDASIQNLVSTSINHSSEINTLNQQVAVANSKVQRVATDPATSRSTRMGSDTNNLTVSAAKDAEGMSVQITDNADNDPIRVGFESDAGGDSIIIGDNSYKLRDNPPRMFLFMTTATDVSSTWKKVNLTGNFSGLEPSTRYKGYLCGVYVTAQDIQIGSIYSSIPNIYTAGESTDSNGRMNSVSFGTISIKNTASGATNVGIHYAIMVEKM
jgi:hypothetical protein